MELSLNGQEPRWHYHAAISNLGDMTTGRKDHRVTIYRSLLPFREVAPDISFCFAKGRAAAQAAHRLHCYCQWHKIGSVIREDNFPRGEDWVCKASWTIVGSCGR